MTENEIQDLHPVTQFRIGDIFEFSRTLSRQDVLDFANLTGDHNPLHTDPEFAKKTPFQNNIVHGLLLGSLFSTLVGMYCPGKHALYLSQTLNFRSPVFYGETVSVVGKVIGINESIGVVTLETKILRDGKVMVSGEAKAKVLEDRK